MTDKKQDAHAKLMQLVAALDAAAAGDGAHDCHPSSRTKMSLTAIDAFARQLTDRIAELEAQLEAVGAGGVGMLMATKIAPTVPDKMQDWAGMDGAIAWHLIERHADNWADIGKMMGEWLAANRGAQPAPAVVEPFGYFKAEPFGWTDCAESDEGAIALYEAPPPPAQAQDAWQPIATAPNDGTEILLRSAKGRIANGLWSAASERSGFWAWAYVHQEPVEWMPLPSAQAQTMLAAAPQPQQIAEPASKDTERLDWLEKQGYAYGFEDTHEGNRWTIEGPFMSLRTAIDEGIAANKKEPS